MDTEYNPVNAATPSERAYGAVSEAPAKNFAREDREAEESEATGRVSKREVDELRADAGGISVRGTRNQGKGNDAFKQERELDQALSEEGVI